MRNRHFWNERRKPEIAGKLADARDAITAQPLIPAVKYLVVVL
ncbi:hypothetical protein [Nitratireductor arenosus]|nr:hypothetical protein [Nitratireductor arenosus]